MRYRSKPAEVKALRWCHLACPEPEVHSRCHDDDAWSVVEWVNANGGEARHIPAGPLALATGQKPLIGVRTINGWSYAEPGHYVVMGDATFAVHIPSASDDERNDTNRVCRDFYPCDPETFERRWEPVGASPVTRIETT